MRIRRDTLERVLSDRRSAWLAWAAVLPLLLAVLLLGRITYEVGRQAAPVITRMLTPPVTRRPEPVSFEEAAPVATFSGDFGDFEREQEATFTIPTVDDVPAEAPTDVDTPAPEVALETGEFAESAFDFDSESFADPGASLLDTDQRPVAGDAETTDAATLRRAGRERRAVAAGSGRSVPDGGAAAGDASGKVAADPGLGQAVRLSGRPAAGEGSGAGVDRPVSREKMDLAGWILENQAPLRPAVQEALGQSDLKQDRTAMGSAVDSDGLLYQFFFLHRTENNLLRILVVQGRRAWRIDLPDFYLEANHVRAGQATRGQATGGEPGPIIEVALESVDAVPGEVPAVFDLVLQWLDIKGEE